MQHRTSSTFGSSVATPSAIEIPIWIWNKSSAELSPLSRYLRR